MIVLRLDSIIVFLMSSVHIAAACEIGAYDKCPGWDPCDKSCGGRQCRTCESCVWSAHKRFCQNCNEWCYNGHRFINGRCQCPNWRYGDCCETCIHIYIPHCVSGQQQCGGSPDGIMCTQCEPGYHSGGYNQGCLETDECAAGTSGCAQQCTNTQGSYECSCLPGYWLWTDKHTCNCDNCTFESDSTCAWTDVTSGDDFDWTLTYGARGKYMYIGTSGSRKVGETAWLTSPMLRPTAFTERCLMFGYNMNGPSIGLLSVYMTAHGEKPGPLLWRMSGDQGQEWKGASVNLSSLEQYQVIIEAVVGNSYFGDIAIDDVAILPTACQQEKGLLIG
ncbi:MAM and LDL-receptor class A domain-containing protein 1-like isoform X3 [Dreissena polymorpha]|uniref:MAM and LDL-receptor class A domain-containing protein 1-like isoform X3 n=1 Tax=Dreissena polymorpha TaxID=45954 RepID=UPI0022645F87|nr:MAM and LDL-receptor class A domain-containing protein 1-like isoform X3 [Dreissena polymorpha]